MAAAAVPSSPAAGANLRRGPSSGIGIAGAVTGALALGGGRGSLTVPMALPFDPVVLAPDRLGGFFMVVAGVVGAVAALYGDRLRAGTGCLAHFMVGDGPVSPGIQLVPAAADAVSFLLCWELMAVASTVLLLADHARRAPVRRLPCGTR